MSTISGVGSGYSFTSPLEMLKNELTKEVSSGTVASGDQDALSSALDSIDSSLKSARESDRSSGTRPSPDEMKSKVDDLIAAQVSSGALTSDQAEELKGVFQNAFASGPGGAGGPGGPGGPPPGGPGGPGGAGGPGGSDSASGASDSDDTSKSDLEKLLAEFLAKLKDSSSETSSYDGAGQTQSSVASLLFDYQA